MLTYVELLPRVMSFVLCICRELAKDFVVAGTASESLYGACEAMFKPDMVCFCTQLIKICYLNCLYFSTYLVLSSRYFICLDYHICSIQLSRTWLL